ncbi:MAG: hypothetical protein V1816_16050 [Pseudomonadota bacterium]
MIRYPISRQELENLIEREKPGWTGRAQERTNQFAALGRYEESSSIWSEVKVVYLRLQHGKCAYCERQLESEEYGQVEHDLEHFRPKKAAKPWTAPLALREAGIKITAPVNGDADPGYHLLAYNPLNYCTSCKTCNSGLKKDFFPIEGKRESKGADPARLSSEKPLLVNPVGDFDDDPAALIGFYGLSPLAVPGPAYQRRRGLVSIAFFHLDDLKRKYLFRERAQIIVDLYSFLGQVEHARDPEFKGIYEDIVETMTKPSAPHSNCARSYRELYHQDKNEAGDIFRLASSYLRSIS